LRVHIVPLIGTIPLAKLAPQHVQRLQHEMADKGLSLATIRLGRAVLGAGLTQAERWGLVARNVVDLVEAPSGSVREADVLSPEQAGRFLEAARGDDYENLYRLLLATGLRIGEALGLRWSDIDAGYRELRVRQQLIELPGKPKTFSEPKSASSKRVVPIIPMAAEALHAQRSRVLRDHLRLADLWQDQDLVFCDELGAPMATRAVRVHLHRATAIADLPATVTPHTLRHSAATYLLAAGVPDRVVMEILGHSSIAMTSRYEHVLSDMLASAGEKLSRFLSTASA
jgi:integrase